MNLIPEDFIEQLRQHAKHHDLDKVARKALEMWFNDEDYDLPIDPKDITVKFRSRSLYFETTLVGYPYIDTRFDLFYEGAEIGYYRLITLLDGSPEDDYFVIDKYQPE